MKKIKSVKIVDGSPDMIVEVIMGDDKILYLNLSDAEGIIKEWLSVHGFNIVEVPGKGEWIEL